MRGADHELPSQVSTRPPESTAAQNPDDGQDTEASPPLASIRSGADHELPSQVRARPLPSTATQKPRAGQETDVSAPPPGSTGREADQTGRDHEVPSQVRARPRLSTAAQNEADEHETAVSTPAIGSMSAGGDQDGSPPRGCAPRLGGALPVTGAAARERAAVTVDRGAERRLRAGYRGEDARTRVGEGADGDAVARAACRIVRAGNGGVRPYGGG